MGFRDAIRRFMGIPQPPPPIDDRRVGPGSWAAGDLGVCINDQWHGSNGRRSPKKEELIRVVCVREGVANETLIMITSLVLEGYGNAGFDISAFRKIRPDRGAEEVEAGIIEKIKGGKVKEGLGNG